MQIMNLVFVLYGLLVYPLFMALALRNIGILSITKKEILLYYAIFTASSCGAYFLSVKYLLAFAMPLVLFILNHKHNHLTKSVSTILVAFMLYIASDVVAFLVFIIFKINIHASSFIIKTMSLVISSIIIFALSKVVGIIMRKFNSDIWEDENIADGFGNLVIIVFAIYIISMIGKYMEAIKVTKNAIMYGSVIILSFLIVISILRLKFENAVRKLELKHQKEYQSANSNYLKEIEEHYNSLRIFKHDYLNILASMRGYIDSEDLAGLKSYFYDEILANSKNIVYDDKILADLQYLKISEVKSFADTSQENRATGFYHQSQ